MWLLLSLGVTVLLHPSHQYYNIPHTSCPPSCPPLLAPASLGRDAAGGDRLVGEEDAKAKVREKMYEKKTEG